MERRELLRLLTSLGAGTAVSSLVPTESAGQAPVRDESHGRGPALILGSPITASKSGRGDDPIAAIRQGYLDRFTDRYQVIVMDYPPTGAEAAAAVTSFVPDRVCASVLAVANAAGVERFAWYGYSWGGLAGLQLASSGWAGRSGWWRGPGTTCSLGRRSSSRSCAPFWIQSCCRGEGEASIAINVADRFRRADRRRSRGSGLRARERPTRRRLGAQGSAR